MCEKLIIQLKQITFKAPITKNSKWVMSAVKRTGEESQVRNPSERKRPEFPIVSKNNTLQPWALGQQTNTGSRGNIQNYNKQTN